MNALLNIVPWYWRAFGVLGLALASALTAGILVARYEQGRQDHVQLAQDQAAAAALAVTHRHNDQEVSAYVARIEALGNSLAATRARLDRVCDVGQSVHGVGSADAAAALHAGDGRADRDAIAAELLAHEANAAQCRGLQAELRPQIAR